MGCGPRNFGADWVHIDGGKHEHLNYQSILNLKQFKNNTVSLIYASHVIEYFDQKEVLELLKEWNRVMVPGGTLRLAVPDFDIICKLYSSGVHIDKLIGPLYGRMEMDSNWRYHKTVYDLKSIKEMLKSCGFDNIKRYDWRKTEHANFDDHSQAYYPHMNKETGVLISLNVECEKC